MSPYLIEKKGKQGGNKEKQKKRRGRFKGGKGERSRETKEVVFAQDWRRIN